MSTIAGTFERRSGEGGGEQRKKGLRTTKRTPHPGLERSAHSCPPQIVPYGPRPTASTPPPRVTSPPSGGRDIDPRISVQVVKGQNDDERRTNNGGQNPQESKSKSKRPKKRTAATAGRHYAHFISRRIRCTPVHERRLGKGVDATAVKAGFCVPPVRRKRHRRTGQERKRGRRSLLLADAAPSYSGMSGPSCIAFNVADMRDESKDSKADADEVGRKAGRRPGPEYRHQVIGRYIRPLLTLTTKVNADIYSLFLPNIAGIRRDGLELARARSEWPSRLPLAPSQILNWTQERCRAGSDVSLKRLQVAFFSRSSGCAEWGRRGVQAAPLVFSRREEIGGRARDLRTPPATTLQVAFDTFIPSSPNNPIPAASIGPSSDSFSFPYVDARVMDIHDPRRPLHKRAGAAPFLSIALDRDKGRWARVGVLLARAVLGVGRKAVEGSRATRSLLSPSPPPTFPPRAAAELWGEDRGEGGVGSARYAADWAECAVRVEQWGGGGDAWDMSSEAPGSPPAFCNSGIAVCARACSSRKPPTLESVEHGHAWLTD
ncbi:hypothetical protein C8F04DRAFT_1365249 [Mycena alexandri]|uniref:Uncharacterized protein n=1 Tax=Mycena alexandri TaxID=1745969 RepID=A0AAD6RV75_9AGAR|nr:hypothetical protein C8F04DRAFT_1365249 [Mycena alexandri]